MSKRKVREAFKQNPPKVIEGGEYIRYDQYKEEAKARAVAEALREKYGLHARVLKDPKSGMWCVFIRKKPKVAA